MSCLALLATSAPGQTIADYSRLQREAIDKAMGSPAAHAAGTVAPGSPPVATSAPTSSTPRPSPPPATSVSVSGVFASASRVVAEVVVDGRAFLLSIGQAVPGTPWCVDAIAVDRVELAAVDPADRRGRGVPKRMTFALAPIPGGRP